MTYRILIVDDEPEARRALELHLLNENDYELMHANNGQEVVERIGEFAPDVILLDVMMPEMDGYAVCRYLKGDETWKHIPIILVTALSSTESVVQGLEAGADDVLRKPVDNIELKARIRSMLRIKKQFDALAANLRVREDLSSMMVHDMRNSLTTISYYSQFLLNADAIEQKYRTGMETIYKEADRLNSFINDLLMVTKMEQGKMMLNCEPTDVNELLYDIQQNHTVVAQARGITFEVDVPEESPFVSLDRNLFQRLLDNLVSNALKFSPSETTVRVEVEYPLTHSANGTDEHSYSIRFKVRDEGPGIPAEYREGIFNKFETVKMDEDSQSKAPQIGLGLTLCKMVTDAHGGNIYVEDNDPHGAVFVVEV